MRGSILRLAVPAAGFALLAAGVHADPAAIQWAKSFESAIATARASNKLVMADFYTDW